MKKCREKLGYTQKELAERTQTSRSYISRLEKNDFNPSTQMVVNIAITLGVSIDYLLLETERKTV